jgi:hypothetical protein
VIQTIITGETNLTMSRASPDIELAMDLGLIRWDTQTGFTISNPIYEEIMTRYLDAPYHDNLPPPSTWQWAKPDGTLDMDALLKAFQGFWQTNSEVWEQAADYPEAFPHLLLMAFLQRITNGAGSAMDGATENAGVCNSKLQVQNCHGGQFCYEYAAGRGRMDLAVEYQGAWNILEIKLLRQGKSFEKVMTEGIKQTLGYRDSFSGSNSGTPGNKFPLKCYLIIFDRRPDKPAWAERIKWINNEDVTVVGC